MRLLILIFIIYTPFAYTKGTPYKIEYDFAGHGDDWYGKTGPRTQRTDFYQQTDIPTQQGDDFCQGYESSLVHFEQGPELFRTQQSGSAYSFRFKGGTRCLKIDPPPPLPDLIFSNGFEG